MKRVTPEQQRRAGLAVAARIIDRGTTVTKLAAAASVSPTTIRAVIRGVRWPNATTRDALDAALDWPAGEIHRRALLGDVRLSQFTIMELLREVCRRVEQADSVPLLADSATLLPTGR